MSIVPAVDPRDSPPIPVTNVEQYLERVATFDSSKPNSTDDSPRFYYRGMYRKSWHLTPSLSRRIDELAKVHGYKDIGALQRCIMHRLIRYAEHYKPQSTHMSRADDFMSWLCIGQHFGFPTQLLDFSLNPMVGLYFACKDDNAEQFKTSSELLVKLTQDIKKIKDEMAAGRLADPGKAAELLEEALRQTTEPREGDQGAVWVMLVKNKKDREHGSVVHLEKSVFNHEASDQETQAESTVLRTLTQTGNLQFPCIVVPRLLTERIGNTDARFVYSSQSEPIDSLPEDDMKHVPWHYVRQLFTVEQEKKEEILYALRRYRIHEGSMRADLDGYSAYLRDGGR